MKIGITCYSTYGGSGVLASELGKFLAKRGHEVHFITADIPYRLQREYQEGMYFHSVAMEPYPLFDYPPYDLALASKMKEVFSSEGLDLLHVHYAIPHAVCAFLAARMMEPVPLPIVTTLHGTDITLVGQQKGFFDITRLGINRSTAATAVSEYLRERTENIFHPEKPVRRIYNFVDTELFRRSPDSCHRARFARPGQPVYLHISNFRPVKRVGDVMRIFARARETVDGVLVMVGEGPTVLEARELADSLGIREHVHFLGKQQDIPAILACADIFLFPSELESFGLAPLEAMSCEMPVIATRSGGVPEVVRDGEAGFLAEVGDVEYMAARAAELGRDRDLRREMGRAGRKVALEKFHPDIIVPQYERLYEQAMVEAGSRP